MIGWVRKFFSQLQDTPKANRKDTRGISKMTCIIELPQQAKKQIIADISTHFCKSIYNKYLKGKGKKKKKKGERGFIIHHKTISCTQKIKYIVSLLKMCPEYELTVIFFQM